MSRRGGRGTVLDRLRGRIQCGEFAPGTRLPAERELAHELVVSRATVRAAIHDLIVEGLLDQKTNCRPTVRGSYPNRPSSLSSRTGRVAVWMHEDDSDIGSTLILKGIRRILGHARRQLVVGYPGSNDLETVRQFAESLRTDGDIDGIILWASGDARLLPVYRSLVQSGKSVVCIDRNPPGALDADVVAVDHFRGARTAIEHLIGLGHRRIGMVANDDRVSSVRDRRDGYFSALRDAGIPWDEDLLAEVAFVNAKDLKPSTESAVDRYLALANPPTALFAVNDQVAMYLQDALLSRGLSVPGDMSLVGFDWFLRWLPSGGDLTTVAQPFEKIGEVAAKRLLDRIEGSDCHDPRNIFLSAPLILKSSTRNLVASSGTQLAPSALSVGFELHRASNRPN